MWNKKEREKEEGIDQLLRKILYGKLISRVH